VVVNVAVVVVVVNVAVVVVVSNAVKVHKCWLDIGSVSSLKLDLGQKLLLFLSQKSLTDVCVLKRSKIRFPLPRVLIELAYLNEEVQY